MGAVRKTVAEMIILSVAAVGLAFAANAVRDKGSIDPGRDYFPPSAERPPTPVVEENEKVKTPVAVTPVAKTPDHGYQEVSFAQAVEIFKDPNTAMGMNIFVDARDDDHFEEGHIPGAIQADHYQLDDYIDDLLDQALGADKIVVYCNGGQCTDSIYMCTDLIEFDVDYDRIYLFPGGWEEWTRNNMPVATGRNNAEGTED